MKERYAVLGNRFICHDEDEPEWIMEEGFDLTHQVVSVYLVMRGIFYDGSRRQAMLSMNDLYNTLGFDSNSWRKTQSIRKATELLWLNEYIKFYDILTDGELTYEEICLKGFSFRVEFSKDDKDGRFNGFGGFTRLPEENIKKLLVYVGEEKGVHCYKLIRYYTVIARVCSNERMTGYITQDKLGELFGFSKSTCTKYNEVLAELGLVYCNSGYGRYNKDLKRVVTRCTFFGHRGTVNKYGETLTEDDWLDAIDQMLQESHYRHVDSGNVIELLREEG